MTDEQEKKVAQLIARLKLGIDELLDQPAEPKTPELVWPQGPYRAKRYHRGIGETWHVETDDGKTVCQECSQAEAEAIALGLTLPEFVTWMTGYAIRTKGESGPEISSLHALLVRIDAANVKMPTQEGE